MKLRSSFVANSSSSSFIIELKKNRKPFMCLNNDCKNCKKEICETNIYAINLANYIDNNNDDIFYHNCVDNVIPKNKEEIITYTKMFIEHSNKLLYKDLKDKSIIKQAYFDMLMSVAYSYINALFEGKSLYKDLAEECNYFYDLREDIHCLIQCIENLFYSYKNNCALIGIEIDNHYEPGWQIIDELDYTYENKNIKLRSIDND